MLATAAWRKFRQPESANPVARVGSLYAPALDFLLLGGVSLFLLPVLLLLPLRSTTVAFVMSGLAVVINNPHFAQSYQLFYRGFGGTIAASGSVQRRRYVFAGIAVPVILIAALGYCFASADLTALGLVGNAMAFFVGWHYVKQGYGMLAVDGVLKRQFLTTPEKRAVLANAYAVWFLTWVMTAGSGHTRKLFGVAFYAIKLPPAVEIIAIAIVVVTSIAVGLVIRKRLAAKKGLPINGIAAYLVTLYLWMVAVNISPIWLLVVPALHSLQYLAVTGRFEMNRLAAAPDVESGSESPETPRSARVQFGRFVLASIVLGLLGFWLAPALLDILVLSAASVAGGSFFLFGFWVFINIHHYFIDSVMWRSENQDVKRYLFAQAGVVGGR